MKLKRMIQTLLLLISVTASAFADIDAFNEGVQSANNEASGTKSSHKDSSSSSSQADKELTNALCEVCMTVWLVDNFTASFEPYPYAYDDKYILFNTNNSSLFSGDERSTRFTIATSLVYHNQIGCGNETCLEGYIFKCFGPLFENIVFSDFNDTTGFLRLGGELSLLQTNPFSFILYCQWCRRYGELSISLPENGISYGFFMRSYLTKPIVLEWRFGGTSFGDDYASIMESDLRLGVMVSRIEFYGSWKYLKVTNSTTNDNYFDSNGFSVGTRIYY